MLYLVEVSDSIRFLESRLEEIAEKTDTIDSVASRVEGLPLQELFARVDTLEGNVGRTGSHGRGDSSMGTVAHIEERVQELDSSQKTLLEMINNMSEDFQVTLDVVRNEITDVNARLNLTVRAMTNQAPAGGKIPDALKKELRSQFFPENVEILARRKLRELKHFGSIWEYVKQFARLMLDIRDMSEKDKVFCFVEGLKPWAKTKLYEQRVQDLKSAYAAAERLFDLTSDSQDARRHQRSSFGRNRNSRSSSPKAVGGDKHSSRDRRPYRSNTENTWRRPNNRSPPKRPLSCFICEGPHLARKCPNKADFHAFQASLTPDSDDKSNQVEGEVDQLEEGGKPRIGALKYMSSLQKKVGERSLPVERGLLYVDTWINQKQIMVDSSATHNFITEAEVKRLRLCWEKDSERMKVVNSIALPIVGLVKQTVISMPSAKCLVITGSFPTVVQADIHQPNGFKMILVMQLDKSPVQEKPPSAVILLGRWENWGKQSPKTLCVPKKCHGIMSNSWPKSLLMRRMIDHGIELLPEAKAPAKNAYSMAPPELVELRKPSKKLLSIGFSRPVQALYGAPILSLKKKDRNPQRCIKRRILNKLTASRKYSFSILPNLFDRSCGVKYFPMSDIRSRYCRVRAVKKFGLDRSQYKRTPTATHAKITKDSIGTAVDHNCTGA
ncbi:reverse transcriptase [Cucumis melo var. makuwa]|uniref:Reverse transcriptase n=1 Tax=Cucumis melo var. makuwa TaxID=1194695 RepID=A0A5A7T1T3_CUCMM|nr:reverse transcriptase [Cucumis melo var. makuwa]